MGGRGAAADVFPDADARGAPQGCGAQRRLEGGVGADGLRRAARRHERAEVFEDGRVEASVCLASRFKGDTDASPGRRPWECARAPPGPRAAPTCNWATISL